MDETVEDVADVEEEDELIAAAEAAKASTCFKRAKRLRTYLRHL